MLVILTLVLNTLVLLTVPVANTNERPIGKINVCSLVGTNLYINGYKRVKQASQTLFVKFNKVCIYTKIAASYTFFRHKKERLFSAPC